MYLKLRNLIQKLSDMACQKLRHGAVGFVSKYKLRVMDIFIGSSCEHINSSLMLRFNPLNAELNPICHLLALIAHHILHVSRIRG